MTDSKRHMRHPAYEAIGALRSAIKSGEGYSQQLDELCQRATRDLRDLLEQLETTQRALDNGDSLLSQAGRENERLKEQFDAARRDAARAVFLAEHLWQMIPQGVWRDHGGDDMQGHYEGDYHAAKVREELAALAETYPARSGRDDP